MEFAASSDAPLCAVGAEISEHGRAIGDRTIAIHNCKRELRCQAINLLRHFAAAIATGTSGVSRLHFEEQGLVNGRVFGNRLICSTSAS
jgi:hypothetical protein